MILEYKSKEVRAILILLQRRAGWKAAELQKQKVKNNRKQIKLQAKFEQTSD